MLKIFWDKDNIAFLGDGVNAVRHSHCVIQIFLSLDTPLCVTVGDKEITGMCVVVNKNVPHLFSCGGKLRLSVLIEPSSQFAKELSSAVGGDHAVYDNDIEPLRQKASALATRPDKAAYIAFIADLARYLCVKRSAMPIDARIAEVLNMLKDCDCYDHKVDYLAKAVALSPDRLSHLFRAQVGVPLKSYIIYHQLEKAFSALLNGSSVTDAAMSAGFDSPSHFAATVKKQMGMPATATLKDSEFLKVFC